MLSPCPNVASAGIDRPVALFGLIEAVPQPGIAMYWQACLLGGTTVALALTLASGWACLRRVRRRQTSGRHGACSPVTKRHAGAVVTCVQRSGGKNIWFVRHGQAQHNILYESGQVEACKALVDPELTALGQQQALRIAEDPLLAPYLDGGGIELVVASPLSRTVETALRAFGGWVGASPGRRIVLKAELQETGDVPCDTGSPLLVLQERFATQAGALDFSNLWQGWEVKRGDFEDSGTALSARLLRFRDWLAARPESRIAVVGHHNFLVALLKVTFLNCEVRQYELTPEGSWKSLVAVSTSDSELSEAERAHLRVYDPMVRRKFKAWGIDAPGRLR